jgi:hypothetical protein
LRERAFQDCPTVIKNVLMIYIKAILGSERSKFLNYTANYLKHPFIRKTEISFMTHNDMIGDDDV